MKHLKKPWKSAIAVICTVATLASSTMSSSYLFVEASEDNTDLAPIAVVFDTQEKVDQATFLDNGKTFEVTKTLKEDAEKKYVSVECTPTGSAGLDLRYSNFISQSGNDSIQLEDYPYMRISYRYTPDAPLTYESIMFMATGSEGTLYDVAGYNASMLETPDGTWKDIVLNFANNTYTIYDQAGDVEISTRTFSNSNQIWVDTWEGTATNLNICPVNGVAKHTVYDIAYIALFATEDEAVLYPDTPAKVALTDALDDMEFTANYEEACTIELASAIAKTQIQDVINEQATTSGSESTFTMSNSEISLSSTQGIFSSDVTISMPGSITFVYKFSMTLTGRKAPITVVFDTQEKVEQATFYDNGGSFGVTKTLKEDTEKKYVSVECTPEGTSGLDLRYSNFISQSGNESIQLEDYPYMRISYRYTPDQKLGWESMMFMATGSESTLYDVAGYNASMLETPDGTWKDIVLNFANNTYTIYDQAGDVEISTRTFSNSNQIWVDTWEGTATNLNICPVNGVAKHTVYDIAYIALFATEDEAVLYPDTPAKVALTDALDDMEFTANYEEACTIELASAIAKTQIQDVINEQATTIGRESTFTMSNSEISLSGTEGIFSSDVTISMPGSITFGYKFNMTLTGRKAPITVVFDTQEKVEQATFYDNGGTFEVTKTLNEDTEKKYVSVECTPTGTSGLDLRYSNFISQSGNESIQLENYPFMRISYRYTPDQKLGWESMMFMATGSESTLYDVAGYNASMLETPDGTWKDIVLNFANNTYTIYDEAGDVEISTRTFSNSNQIWVDTWEGTATSLNICPVNGVAKHTVYDIAYIALFATEAEAISYRGAVQKSTHSVYYSEIKNFRANGFTAPTAEDGLPEGYVFAGWYVDEECTTAIKQSVTSGPAYAKFVDADVLTVQTQVGLTTDNTLPDDKTAFRFVTTVDSLSYSRVAFKLAMQIDAETDTYTKEIDTYDTYNPDDPNVNSVYEQLYAIGSDDKTITYAPTKFSPSSYRFKAWTLNDIPEQQYRTNFKIKAYWITLDGTYVEGTPTVRCVRDI